MATNGPAPVPANPTPAPRVDVRNPAAVSVPTPTPVGIRIDRAPAPVPSASQPTVPPVPTLAPGPAPAPDLSPAANRVDTNPGGGGGGGGNTTPSGNTIIITASPGGIEGSIQFNRSGSFSGNVNLRYFNSGVFVGNVPNTLGNLDATGILTARNEVRVGTWGTEYSAIEDNYGRLRMAAANSAPYYGFVGQSGTAATVVLTNEERNFNQAIVLMDGSPYANSEGTIFGVSAIEREVGNTTPTSGTEAGWRKLTQVTNQGNVKIGGSLYIVPNFNSNNPPANNQIGIYFADGSYQYTAASVAVQDEGANVVTGATTINFTGAGVTASNVGGVATVNIPSGGAQGTTGAQGTNGSQGATGRTGNNGTNGTNGAQGTQGTSGAFAGQGATGSQGTQGPSGTNGTNGVQGAQGTQGVDGAFAGQGVQGPTGTQGTVGTQGTQGIAGEFAGIGAQGATGAQGAALGPAGSNTQIQFNNAGAFGANAAFTFDYVTSNAQIGTLQNSGNLRVGGQVEVGNVADDNYGRFRQANANANISASTFYGFGTANIYSPETVVITNEEANTNQAILLADSSFGQDYTVFGISTNANIANGTPSTGYEANWQKLLDLRGNNFYVQAMSESTAPNNILYYEPTTGLITYGLGPITVQDEGANVVAPAQTLNFVGAGVTATNTDGVATITVPGDSIYNLGNITGNTTVVLNNGTIQTCTLTGNVTFDITSVTTAKSLTLIMTQGSGGNKFINFGATPMLYAYSYKTLSTSANAVDMLNIVNVGNTYYSTLTTGYAV